MFFLNRNANRASVSVADYGRSRQCVPHHNALICSGWPDKQGTYVALSPV